MLSFKTTFLLSVIPLLSTLLQLGKCQIYSDCGLVEMEDTLGDSRTKTPWSAVIYLKNKNSGGKYVDWTSGVVIGPYTVLTRGRNFWESEANPNKTRIRMHGFKPINFVVGVGLKSRKLSASFNIDKHSQFHQVKYIRPYYKSYKEHSDYDFTIIQLKTKIQFSSRVTPICVESYSDAKFTSPKCKFIADAPLFLSGYRYYEKYTLAGTLSFKFDPRIDVCNEECQKNAPKSTNDQFANHGPPCNRDDPFQPTSLRDFFLVGASLAAQHDGRWYLAGMVTKSYGCNQTYNHFLSLVTLENNLVWLEDSVKNGPDVYTCSDGNAIDLNKLCDGRRDCSVSGDDEDFAFCDAWNCPPGSLNHDTCNIPNIEENLSQMSNGDKDISFEPKYDVEETTTLNSMQDGDTSVDAEEFFIKL